MIEIEPMVEIFVIGMRKLKVSDAERRVREGVHTPYNSYVLYHVLNVHTHSSKSTLSYTLI